MLEFSADNYVKAITALGARAFEAFADGINEETGEFKSPEASIELDMGDGATLVIALTIDVKASDAE